MEEKVIWKNVTGEFDGWPYEVSNKGEVYSKRSGFILRSVRGKDDYIRILLCLNYVKRVLISIV